jgi:secreted trypsin-like serine protease
MRRLILLLATMGVAVLVASGAALAINNGTPDTTKPYRYPYVGALVDDAGAYCSGTLIAPKVFLTAAHCYPLEGNTSYVTFEPTFTLTRQESRNFPESVSSRISSGTFIDDPDGTDIAVVKLSTTPLNQNTGQAFTQESLPSLPTDHQLDNLDLVKGVSKFTAVGYGGSLDPNKVPGGPWERLTYSDQRAWGFSTFNTLGRTYLRLSQKDGSGTCYGDSGGPNFLGEYPYPNNVPVIASTTITGDSWCQTTNVTLRLDTQPVRDFLKAEGVTVP